MTRLPFHLLHRWLLVAVTCLCAAAPYDLDSQSGKFIPAASFAKDGGNGGGHGNGSGNGNDGGNGNSGGASNGNSGGNSGNSGKNGASGDSGSSSSSSSSTANGSSNDDPSSGDSQTPVNVHHRNGFSEAISKGRYTMRDPKGRVVIDRNVKPADLKRLKTPSD